MTNATTIKTTLDVAAQWADTVCLSQFGSGYRSAMVDLITALTQSPAGKEWAKTQKRKGKK